MARKDLCLLYLTSHRPESNWIKIIAKVPYCMFVQQSPFAKIKSFYLRSVHWPGGVVGCKIIRPLFQWKTTRSLLRKKEGCENNFSHLKPKFSKTTRKKNLMQLPSRGDEEKSNLCATLLRWQRPNWVNSFLKEQKVHYALICNWLRIQ